MSCKGGNRYLLVALALMFLAPSLAPPQASGGSTWGVSAPAAWNATFVNTTQTDEGVRLAYDPTQLGNWTNLGARPVARAGGKMVYDERNGVMVLFGGFNRDGKLNDTWTYNLSTNAWREMRPPTAPLARTYHLMAYDSSRGLVVLYGGVTAKNEECFDTWTYNVSS